MNLRLLSLALLSAAALAAAPVAVSPQADRRVSDRDGNGTADDGGSNERDELLSVGDIAGNGYWRSILIFDLSEHVEAVRAAKRVELQLTAKNVLGTPMPIQVLNLVPSSRQITISVSGGSNDDFSRQGEVIARSECAMLKTGDELALDLTKAVQAAVRAGERQLTLRLQTEVPNNDNPHNDRVSFASGSHGVNASAGGARLVIER